MEYRPFPVKTLLKILLIAALIIGTGLLLWQGRQRKLERTLFQTIFGKKR